MDTNNNFNLNYTNIFNEKINEGYIEELTPLINIYKKINDNFNLNDIKNKSIIKSKKLITITNNFNNLKKLFKSNIIKGINNYYIENKIYNKFNYDDYSDICNKKIVDYIFEYKYFDSLYEYVNIQQLYNVYCTLFIPIFIKKMKLNNDGNTQKIILNYIKK